MTVANWICEVGPFYCSDGVATAWLWVAIFLIVFPAIVVTVVLTLDHGTAWYYAWLYGIFVLGAMSVLVLLLTTLIYIATLSTEVQIILGVIIGLLGVSLIAHGVREFYENLIDK